MSIFSNYFDNRLIIPALFQAKRSISNFHFIHFEVVALGSGTLWFVFILEILWTKESYAGGNE